MNDMESSHSYVPFIQEAYKEKFMQYLFKYAKKTTGSLTMCTLYSINKTSTVGRGTESYFEKIGEKSPLKFTRIKNYPLFNVQTRASEINFSFEDGFRNSETTTQVVSIPLSYEINVGDLIIFDIIDKEVVYEVQPQTVGESFVTTEDTFKTFQLKVIDTDMTSLELQVNDKLEYNFNTNVFEDEDVLSKLAVINNYIKNIWNTHFKAGVLSQKGMFDTVPNNQYAEEFMNLIYNGNQVISLGALKSFFLPQFKDFALPITADFDLKNDTMPEILTKLGTLTFTIDDIKLFNALLRKMKTYKQYYSITRYSNVMEVV
jgi:hypothetical protein